MLHRRELLATTFAAAICLGSERAGRSVHGGSQSGRQAFDQMMRQLYAKGEVVGLQWGWLDWGEQPRLGHAGVLDVDTGQQVSVSTRFLIASVTKAIVATCMLQVVERGGVRLETPVADFFPQFPRASDITIYHLLTHTSGLKDWWEGGVEDVPRDWLTQAEPHKVLAQMKSPFHFEPGTAHWYSSSGYILLGNILEAVDHVRLQQVLDSRIVEPLCLRDTALSGAIRPKDLAKGYHFDSRAETEERFSKAEFQTSLGAAGGILSSARDLLTFSEGLFGHTMLSPRMIEQMSTMGRLSDNRPISDSNWRPPALGDLPEPPSFMNSIGWGLGVSLFDHCESPVVWHSGGCPGGNVIWLNFPKQRRSIVMLANTDNGAVPVFREGVELATGCRPEPRSE